MPVFNSSYFGIFWIQPHDLWQAPARNGVQARGGQAVAKASGKTWGGSKAGVRKRVTPEQAVTIKRLKDDGVPITRIAKTVGLSRPTIYDVLGGE